MKMMQLKYNFQVNSKLLSFSIRRKLILLFTFSNYYCQILLLIFNCFSDFSVIIFRHFIYSFVLEGINDENDAAEVQFSSELETPIVLNKTKIDSIIPKLSENGLFIFIPLSSPFSFSFQISYFFFSLSLLSPYFHPSFQSF